MRMFKMPVAILMTASTVFVTGAIAQTQAPSPTRQRPPSADRPTQGKEKTVEGEVQSINSSRTEITLTDGTKLVAPRGAALKPGVLSEGAIVIASYIEEDGKKVLTGLEMKEPSASPPSGPRSPSGSSTAPPSQAPQRY